MTIRYVETDRWNDPWYRNLSPSAKLIFNFLCDRCDLAGFYERDDAAVAYFTGIDLALVALAVSELERGVVERGRWLFVKNFIRHQKNFNLSLKNPAHLHIARILKKRKAKFSDVFSSVGIVVPNLPEDFALDGKVEDVAPREGLGRAWGGPGEGLGRALGIGTGTDTDAFYKLTQGEGGPGEGVIIDPALVKPPTVVARKVSKLEPPVVTGQVKDFVDSFGVVYERLAGHPFKASRKAQEVSRDLIGRYGVGVLIEKSKILAKMCVERSTWFTQEGPGDFTIEKLSSMWNSIIRTYKETPEDKKRREDAEAVRKVREERERSNDLLKRR